MANITKRTRAIVIGAGVLLALGIVLFILVLTEPKIESQTSSDTTSIESTAINITEKQAENILKVTIKNSTGEYTFDKENDTWNIKSLGEVTMNSATISALMTNLSAISTIQLVEENAENLDKYGLENPVSQAKIEFDDGTVTEIYLGILNNTGAYYYFRLKDSKDVHYVSTYKLGSLLYRAEDFVSTALVESYDSESGQIMDHMTISRNDLDKPIVIEAIPAETEESDIIATFNEHKFISPYSIEVDASRSSEVIYGMYGLTAASCVYINPTEEQLDSTGLDNPQCVVTMKTSGRTYTLSIGNSIKEITESESDDVPDIVTITGYYVMINGSDIIYSISPESLPWLTANVSDLMSRMPLSPYIYSLSKLTISTAEKTYEFDVEGDSTDYAFFFEGEEIQTDKFKQLYQYLISTVGEELYSEEPSGDLIASIKYSYKDTTKPDDIIEYYASDDRKSIIRINGTTLYKVRQMYTEKLLTNIDALMNGGNISLEW